MLSRFGCFTVNLVFLKLVPNVFILLRFFWAQLPELTCHPHGLLHLTPVLADVSPTTFSHNLFLYPNANHVLRLVGVVSLVCIGLVWWFGGPVTARHPLG